MELNVFVLECKAACILRLEQFGQFCIMNYFVFKVYVSDFVPCPTVILGYDNPLVIIESELDK